MSKVIIDRLELACELAEYRLKEIITGDIYEYVSENESRFTEEAQDIFNQYYAEYTDIINKLKHEEK